MVSTLKSFVRDESGATMIEYGLIAALVSVVSIVALGAMGGSIKGMFEKVSGCLTAATGGTTC